MELALQPLLDGRLLDADGDAPQVAFHHALLQDAVYGRLLRRRRRELHRRVADAARTLYGDRDDSIDLLARHLYLAEAGQEAVDALLRGARRAAGLFANEAAVTGFRRALELLATGDAARLRSSWSWPRCSCCSRATRTSSTSSPQAWARPAPTRPSPARAP
jgi:hypothetical protein